jgi:hypothetical protein
MQVSTIKCSLQTSLRSPHGGAAGSLGWCPLHNRRRSRLDSVLLHVLRDLVRNFCEHFFGKIRLAQCQVVAIATADEITERYKLQNSV